MATSPLPVRRRKPVVLNSIDIAVTVIELDPLDRIVGFVRRYANRVQSCRMSPAWKLECNDDVFRFGVACIFDEQGERDGYALLGMTADRIELGRRRPVA